MRRPVSFLLRLERVDHWERIAFRWTYPVLGSYLCPSGILAWSLIMVFSLVCLAYEPQGGFRQMLELDCHETLCPFSASLLFWLSKVVRAHSTCGCTLVSQSDCHRGF